MNNHIYKLLLGKSQFKKSHPGIHCKWDVASPKSPFLTITMTDFGLFFNREYQKAGNLPIKTKKMACVTYTRRGVHPKINKPIKCKYLLQQIIKKNDNSEVVEVIFYRTFPQKMKLHN